MFASLLILIAAAAGQPDDPLAPARDGQVQCVNPKAETRTCMAIASYTLREGGYDAVVHTLINPAPLIVMETRSSGTIEGDRICETLDRDDYAASTFTMDGAPLDPAMAEGIKSQLLAAVEPMLGKRACTTQTPQGDVIAAEVTLDGVARPDLAQKLIWVRPEDGYKIGQ